MTELLLGIDVGTSACKAAVVDAGGTEVAHGQAPTPWEQVPTGAEVDPKALEVAGEKLALHDRWIISRLNKTARDVRAALEEYQFHEA